MSLYPLVRPLLMALDAERAHRLAIRALKLAPRRVRPPDDAVLATRVFGLDFANPIGLAAGFDKHAEAPFQAAGLGFGFVELGSVTPQPQPGNPRPRIFRLAEDRAVVNRYGFNSVGVEAFARNLAAARAKSPASRIPIGVNLGKNKDTPAERAAQDFARGASVLAPLASYLVVNVSSPNTPGLRLLQGRAELTAILTAVRAAIRLTAATPPLLLKIAPDLAEADLAEIAEVAGELAVDGVIVSNTTIRRPDRLRSPHRVEAGGLSGAPLKPFALETLRAMRRFTGGRIPLIGVGGIASGADAYDFIRAVAALIQLYTALVYDGPGLVARVKRDLAQFLRRDGFASVGDAVGAAAGGTE
ncbi:MAG: quinone-dependent dihydroorotate dehydrogenase [Rhodospirillaceae bacterium]|nr:quinone-dependent dihydroorotate dehydrogenase [Rhodospirillaceae bacterium]